MLLNQQTLKSYR